MSASKKKKLRSQEAAQKMTERQLQEQKESKKLKLYTVIFVVVLVALVAVALISSIVDTVSNGRNEKNTVAMTVGEHSISNAEFNYYYNDNINVYYQNIQAYASLLGLDPTVALDEQECPQIDGTWADFFVTSTQEQIKYVYALSEAAYAANYQLPAEEQEYVDQIIEQRKSEAATNSLTLDIYLQALYGPGSDADSYEEYIERSVLASSYESKVLGEASFTDEQMREHEKDIFNTYSSFSFTSCYISADKFLDPANGTTDEEGTVTYSDEVKAQALKDAEAAAKEIKAASIKSEADFKAAVKSLKINAESEKIIASPYENTLHDNVNSLYREWVASADRKTGDVEIFEDTRTSYDDDDNEKTTVSGYYVVCFGAVNDNKFELVDVRHVLIKPEGGTTDPNTGMTNYTEAEIEGAKVAAEEMLNLWKAGDTSEASFIELAKNNSADGSAADGGLIADIHPESSLVENFLNWSLDPARTVGETGVVTSPYGAHIMYYCGPNGTTFRDYMITNVMAAAERDAIIEAMTVVPGDISYVNTGLVLRR